MRQCSIFYLSISARNAHEMLMPIMKFSEMFWRNMPNQMYNKNNYNHFCSLVDNAWAFMLRTQYHQQRYSSRILVHWPNHGGGIANRYQAVHEHTTSPHTAATFKNETENRNRRVRLRQSLHSWWHRLLHNLGRWSVRWEWRPWTCIGLKSKTFTDSKNTPVLHKEYLLIGLWVPGLQIAMCVKWRSNALLLLTSILTCLKTTHITINFHVMIVVHLLSPGFSGRAAFHQNWIRLCIVYHEVIYPVSQWGTTAGYYCCWLAAAWPFVWIISC